MPLASRKTLLIALGVVVLGALVFEARNLIHLGGFSGAKLLQALRDANPYYLVLGIVAIYACYGIRSLRWRVFQRNIGPANFWKIYKLTLAGFAAIFLLGRAGEPVRPLLLAKKQDLPVADTFGIYVLERIFDMASIAVIAAIALLFFRTRPDYGDMAASLQAAARTSGVVLFVRRTGCGGRARVYATAWHCRVGAAARNLHSRRRLAELDFPGAPGFRARSANDPDLGRLALAAAYSAVHWAVIAMVYYWVSHSFEGTAAITPAGCAARSWRFLWWVLRCSFPELEAVRRRPPSLPTRRSLE